MILNWQGVLTDFTIRKASELTGDGVRDYLKFKSPIDK
jgi:hypothetical protein